MKKLFTLLLTIAMLMTLTAPAFAAITDTFVDEIVDGFNFNETEGPVIFFTTEGSVEQGAPGHRMAFEQNGDLETTLLLKQDNDRNPNHTEYIVYKMDKNICGFELDAVSCAGLGDILEQLSVFISKTGAEGSWVEVKTQATMYEYDENIYLEWDMAYWFNTTVYNAQQLPVGYKYLKIQFNACNDTGDVPWNVAIDTVKIHKGTPTAPVTIPADKLLTKTWDQINEERDATKTTQDQNNTTANNNTTEATNNGNGGNTGSSGNATTATTAPITIDQNAATSVVTDADGKTMAVAIVTDADGATVTVAVETNADGELVAIPTSATDENGETITTNANDDGNTVGAIGGDNQDDGDNAKKGGAVLWIVLGLVVLAGAGAAVYFFVLKKEGDVE